jgi:hypothetical protein
VPNLSGVQYLVNSGTSSNFRNIVWNPISAACPQFGKFVDAIVLDVGAAIVVDKLDWQETLQVVLT